MGRAEQKKQSHETILDAATRLLRERGVAGARVADVMAGAGLTVGGFYAHFESKEALVDAALRRAAGHMRDRLLVRIEDKPANDRAEVILKRYLSAGHRDNRDGGCPLPSVVGEIGTTAPAHSPVLTDEMEKTFEELERRTADGTSVKPGAPTRRAEAIAMFCMMYGGLTLARALGGDLSDEVLRACRSVGRALFRHDPDEAHSAEKKS